MAYWGATKEHTSFWSNNEQVANICICNGLCGSDPTNIRKGKASRGSGHSICSIFWMIQGMYHSQMSILGALHFIIDVTLQLVSSTLHPIQPSNVHLSLSLRMQPQTSFATLNNRMMSCHQKTDQLRRNTKGKTVKDCSHARLNQNDSRYKLKCSL